jgi:hypothetical protein
MGVDATGDNVKRKKTLVDWQDADVPSEMPVTPAHVGTLLPGPIASAVSFATRSTSFALRIGTAISGYGLGAAKVTTLSSLELGRGILDGILSRAGRDVFVGSRSELARADAESILETSLESLHQTMSQIVFWTVAGFHAAGTTISTASQVSQLFLSVLDQFFGSTDSSRAIASIITLIRREFQNPATGVEGEKVGITDLVLGLCGLAYLQKRCRKMIQEESRSLGYEEIIWDVVVLNDGARVDTLQDGFRNVDRSQIPRAADVDGVVGAIEGQNLRLSSADEWNDLPETQVRQQIMKSLPKDTKISVTTSTTTTKMIAVDIEGAFGMPIPSFPGLDIVQSEFISDPHQSITNGQGQPSNYRVVYKLTRNTVGSIPEDSQDKSYVEEVEEDNEGQSLLPTGLGIRNINVPPPVPSKATRPTIASSAKGHANVSNGSLAGRARSASDNSSGSGSSLTKERSFTSVVEGANEHAANQKRTRQPLDEPRKTTKGLTVQIPSNDASYLDKKAGRKSDTILAKSGEKRTGFRSAPKKRPVPAFANSPSRGLNSEDIAGFKSKPDTKPPWSSYKRAHNKSSSAHPSSPVSERTSIIVPSREAPHSPQRGNPNYFSSRDLGSLENSLHHSEARRPPVQNRRRNSIISLTDTYSVHSYESRSPSPTLHQNEVKASIGALKPSQVYGDGLSTPSSRPTHHRAHSWGHSVHSPSIYTLETRDSQASLVSSFHQKGAYSDSEALESLRKSGSVRGMFPDAHFLRNITRYSRFASAVYGHNFLKLMGISKDRPISNIADEIHHDVRSFTHHTKLPAHSILLSSFVDPQGGSDSTGATDTGVPLIHTVALDEESKAVVLTCRGTLGFEDVLADMMCDYDNLTWRGKTYKVHKGIHASARRLLYGGDGRVLLTIKAALEEYPEYGLVLCGHSLGGAVTALLGAMLSEPSVTGIGFVTSAAEHRRLLSDAGSPETPTHVYLPSGRPIHVFAYGPPATMSPSLQLATKGLITSIVYGNDLVPYLSLGVLHDFQALALAFKSDNNEAKAEVKRRVWEGLRSGLVDTWYSNPTSQSDEEDDNWVYVALKTLRVSMMSSKLLPPGEVFTVETTPVMRRDGPTQASIEDIGKPAMRIVLKYIRDVEAHFREVRFGSSMLTDHSPGRYEDALRRLNLGVVEMS